MHDSKWKAGFRRKLFRWFDENQRDLPWRKNKTAYRIWISEIMLQQTQVKTVVGYYDRFIKRFPTVTDLADADQSEVLKLWEGLGYYRRARRMHAAAQKVVEDHDGKFPLSFDEVLALPGIGRYTAGAILSIAEDQSHPILEGNTIRLFARLMEMETDPRTSANQKLLWKFSESILPRHRVGDFNQALMELGSEVCHPKNPQCLICPVRSQCPTCIRGRQQQIPAASRKTKYESVREAVVIVESEKRYLIRKCLPGDWWAGLWDFPRFRLNDDDLNKVRNGLKEMTGLSVGDLTHVKTLKHAVTKYRITLDCYRGEAGKLNQPFDRSGFQWATLQQLQELPLSATGRKITDTLA
ncbi:MAG: A/G-specific adenine glycosylase [Planctomycetota bacterium]